MNGNQTYEKIVKVSYRGKHLAKTVSLIMSYALFFSVWLISALNSGNRASLILVAGMLCTLLIVLVTWKYIRLEYEYSFWYGRIEIAKIYGKKKRKQLIETEIKTLLTVAPATNENIAEAERRFEIDDRLVAVSSEQAENIWFALTGGKDEKRILIFFEADERCLSMLKSINPYSFSKR